jgi:(p)ppGpp synthase/HD superfamily hydrolase
MNEYIKRQLQLAEEIAVANHEGQFRRDGKTAYIEHVECVAGHFKGDENDWVQKCVAYLHDVVEDTELTLVDLENIGVDGAVVAAVDALTKEKGVDYFDYLEAVAQNRVARQVKVADILSNLLDNPTADQVSKYSRALLQLVR